MIHVKVKLYATLRKYSPEGGPSGTAFVLELPDTSTLQDITTILRMPDDEVRVAFVNGVIRDVRFGLHDQDEVGMFPPIGGG
jgi:molybdopterin synthase sulfur carrier subunit